MEQFFKELYDNAPGGYVEVRTKSSSISTTFLKVTQFPINIGYTTDCYFGAALRKDPNKGGGKDNLLWSQYAWVDIDNDLPKEYPVPNIMVTTSPNKYHFYYKLKQPIDLTTQEGIDKIENINKQLAIKLGGDRCWNADRILRIPRTINQKNNHEVDYKLYSSHVYAEEIINRLVPQSKLGKSVGSRNLALTTKVGIWYNKGLSDDEIKDKAFELNLKNDPPLDENEVLYVISSVTKTIVSKVSEYSFHQLVRNLTTTTPKEIILSSGMVISGITVMQGGPGIGKSIFALNLIQAALKKGMEVCYIDYENGIHRTLNRMNSMGKTNKRFLYVNYFNRAAIEKTRDLIIIDSIQKLDTGNPVQGLEMYLSKIEDMKNRNNKVFLLLSEKGGNWYDEHSLRAGRYSSRISYASDFLYDMVQGSRRGGTNEIVIRCEKDRDGIGILLDTWVYENRNCKMVYKR